jgi:phosphonate transport system permease protein
VNTAALGGAAASAGAASAASLERLRQRAAAQRSGWLHAFAWALAAAVLAWAWRGAEIRPLDLLKDGANIGQYARDFFPPDFRDWRIYAKELVVTVQIALCGTLLAVVAAVPMALLCSANVSPAWIVQPARRLMDACRAINEMVFAMLFIVAVGLGPFAGVLALAVHTTGTLAKLYAEAVEAIDPRPVEGIRATGAHKLVEIAYGIVPQVMPLWLSFTLYRFESNVRSASVVGMVGAGGIGVVLFEVIRSFQYAQTCAVLILLAVCVTLIDLLSAALRQRCT